MLSILVNCFLFQLVIYQNFRWISEYFRSIFAISFWNLFLYVRRISLSPAGFFIPESLFLYQSSGLIQHKPKDLLGFSEFFKDWQSWIVCSKFKTHLISLSIYTTVKKKIQLFFPFHTGLSLVLSELKTWIYLGKWFLHNNNCIITIILFSHNKSRPRENEVLSSQVKIASGCELCESDCMKFDFHLYPCRCIEDLFFPDECKSVILSTTSMLVTDFRDEMCWRHIWDIRDGSAVFC